MNTQKRFLPLHILVGFLLLVLLVACGSSSEVDEGMLLPVEATPTPPATGRGSGGVLRIIAWAAPTTLNPHLSQGLKDWEASRITLEPLASFDDNGELIPFLAAQIPSLENGDVAADGMSVTWRLRDDIFWSDGEPFTAADVRFTYEYITNPAVGAASTVSYDNVVDVEIISDYVIRVHFNSPNPGWAVPFVGTPGMILPEHIFAPYNGANAREAPGNLHPIGTGPYQVVAFKPQEVLFLGTEIVETNIIIYEPNPFYREPDKPYFGRVELRGGGTVGEAARSVLQDGRADFAPGLQMPAEDLLRLQSAGQGIILPSSTSILEVIEINQTDPNQATAAGERSSLEFPHPFFSDPLVRQALSFAIDRERIAAIYGPAGTAAHNILVAPANYQSPNTSFQYNPERAMALLEEAGWTASGQSGVRLKDGRRLSILLQAPVNPTREQVLEIVQSNLTAIGIEVELRIVDAGGFFGEDVFNPNNSLRALADLQQLDILSSSPDPGPYMQWWTCDQIPQMANDWSAGFNSARWCNQEYDALYRQAVTELDPDRREQLFIQMNDILISEVVMIPLVHEALISAAGLDMIGIELTGWDAYSWKIQDWRRAAP